MSELNVFFRPNGIAVVGASRDPQKLGYGVLRNLIEHNYAGPIYPINRLANEILGLPVYASISDAPDPLELAVLVVPAQYIEAELEKCGKRGVKAVTVISGGFREIGPEGLAREQAIKRVADQYGLLLLGPNCIGTIDTYTPINSTFVTGIPRQGEIGLVSQSGAVAAAVIDWARGAGVGFSRIVSMGNQAGVNESEMLAAVANDSYTKVLTAYIEGVADGQAFVEAASQAAREVPVVALKVGRGAGGAKAVASHTGALAGDEAAYNAAFRRAGVLRANSLEEMFDWARALAWQPLPEGNRVAVLTNAGGPGILAVDAMEEAGLELAPLTDETKAYLQQRVFPAASVENPVDTLAGAGPATYAVCLDALLSDETVDAVVVLQAPQDWFTPVSVAEVIGEVANSPLGRHKPILTALMGLASISEATQVLHQRKVPNFAFPERLGSTLRAMWDRRQWLDALDEKPTPTAIDGHDVDTARMVIEASGQVIRERTDNLLAAASWVPADQVDALLNAYNIRTPRSGMAPNLEQALSMAKTVGYPVALKLAAEGVSHKTDVGGVVLNIRSPEELETAFNELMAHLKQHAPQLTIIGGVYVQQMIRGDAELIVGVVRDPQFGPLVMAGTGGTQVELTRDVAFELAPLTQKQANDLLDRTAAHALLAGYRGAPPADREAVVDAIMNLAQIAVDWPEVSEIEVNPLIVLGGDQGVYAVDARVRMVVD